MKTKNLKNLILSLSLLISSVACNVEMQSQYNASSLSQTHGTDNNPWVDGDNPINPSLIYNEEGYIEDVELLEYLTTEVIQPVLGDLTKLEEMQINIENLQYTPENCTRETNSYTESDSTITEEFAITGDNCDINYYDSVNQEVTNTGKTLKSYSVLEILNADLNETSDLKSAVYQQRLDLLNPQTGSSVYKIDNRISSINLVLSDASEIYYTSEYSDNGIIGVGKISVRSQEVLVKGVTVKGSIESYIVDESSPLLNYYFLNGGQVDESQYRLTFPASLP
ncbi:MAG: hypothetical protein VX583_03060 [Bdellovibrionota bacterium]